MTKIIERAPKIGDEITESEAAEPEVAEPAEAETDDGVDTPEVT